MDWEWGLEGLSFECDENGLKLIGVIFSQLCGYTKKKKHQKTQTHCTVHFKWENFVECKLYLQVVPNKKHFNDNVQSTSKNGWLKLFEILVDRHFISHP